MIPLTMIIVRENSEVVIIYPNDMLSVNPIFLCAGSTLLQIKFTSWFNMQVCCLNPQQT